MDASQRAESTEAYSHDEEMVQKGLEFWNSNRADLTARYPGQYVLIIGERLEGIFQSCFEAVTQGCEIAESADFVVRFTETPQHHKAIAIPTFVLEGHG